MNVQETGLGLTAAKKTRELFMLDRSSIRQRTAAVVKAAAAQVEEIDRPSYAKDVI